MTTTRNRSLIAALVLGIIIVLGAFYRLYQIDVLPPGDGYDPAWYGVDALDILAGKLPIFLPTNFGREVMFSYLTTLTVWLFGAVPAAIHIASALVGILTIPAIYLVAKELFAEEEGVLGDYGALLAAFVLAVSYWHLSWSRFGVRAILIPLFACLTFYFLLRGFRTGSRWSYVLTGVVLGLGMYTYQAARIIPVVVVAGFIIHIAHQRRVSKQDVGNFLIVVGMSLLVFAPLGYYFLTHPGSFAERINQTWAVTPEQGAGSNLQVMWERFTGFFLILLRTGEDKIIYYLLGPPHPRHLLRYILPGGDGHRPVAHQASQRPVHVRVDAGHARACHFGGWPGHQAGDRQPAGGRALHRGGCAGSLGSARPLGEETGHASGTDAQRHRTGGDCVGSARRRLPHLPGLFRRLG